MGRRTQAPMRRMEPDRVLLLFLCASKKAERLARGQLRDRTDACMNRTSAIRPSDRSAVTGGQSL